VKNKNRKNHIYILDDLRGIAILTVVFYHYFFIYFKDIDTANIFITYYKVLNDYVNFGAFGVSLFFIVSGFVIPMSLKGSNKKIVLHNFLIKRFFRLYPTYWFAIIVISTTILLFKDSNAYTIKQILINFTMLQDFFKTKSIDGVFWTLMIELKFYFLTALFFYFGYLKHIKYIVFLFLLISSVTLYLSFIDGTRGFGNGLFSYLMLMYLGTAFYSFYTRVITKTILSILVILVSLYFLNNHFFLTGHDYGARFGYSLATFLAIISFIGGLKYKKTLSTITTFFGKISYSLYLLHQILGYFLISFLVDINTPLAQIVTFLSIALISYLVNKYIEIPTNNYGHKYVKSNK
jgi:peptidoglycan/LPS O-acetylase OafA/YrhL